jgi:ribosomal protein S27AE
MHDSKVCFKCNEEKPLSEFYKHKEMLDGHLNKCKECNKKDVRENRERNIEYYKEYDKLRFQNDPRVKDRNTRYANSENGKKVGNLAKIKWAKNNIIKRSASYIINNAVRDGKIIKPIVCSNCGLENKRIHGHHDNYNYPMVVRWLCPKCHVAWHKENTSIV